MSQQFGMQMPGGRARRQSGVDVYTGLLFAACVALLTACAFAWVQGSKVGPDGNAFGIQDTNRITLQSR